MVGEQGLQKVLFKGLVGESYYELVNGRYEEGGHIKWWVPGGGSPTYLENHQSHEQHLTKPLTNYRVLHFLRLHWHWLTQLVPVNRHICMRNATMLEMN